MQPRPPLRRQRAEAVEETFVALRRVMAAMRTRFFRALREHGLTPPQWILLKGLARNGRMTAKELADMLDVTPANVTGIVDRLERERLVSRHRSDEDRRVVYVRLTERGHEKMQGLIGVMTGVGGDLFEGWSEDELGELRDLLGRIRLRPDDAADL